MKKEVKYFVRQCDKCNNNIKDAIVNMSLDEKIFLKAHIKEKIVHSEKTNIIILEMNFFVSLLALIVAMNFDWGETILGNQLAPLFLEVLDMEIINKVLAVGVCLAIFFGGVLWCCAIQNIKAKYTKALSYLEDYWDAEIKILPSEAASDLSTETLEQTRERYVKEMEEKVSELNEKRAEMDRQIEMCEGVLTQLRDEG